MSAEPNRSDQQEHTPAELWLDKGIYSKSAILKACYWFSRDLWFKLNEASERYRLELGLRQVRPTLESPQPRTLDSLIPEFLVALSDYQLREEVEAETASIRELIIAKAFAEAGVLEDAPPGTFEPPEPVSNPNDLVQLESFTRAQKG